MNEAVVRGPLRFFYFSVPRPIALGYVIAMAALYVFVRVHTPLAIYPGAPHDDTLFMTLGKYLSEGNWLGPYDDFTLMKGPGYPAFLALGNLLGIPVSLATALFHCFAIVFLVVICHRFIKSNLLSGLLLALLLWHPVTLSMYLLRIYRESIYYAQALFFLAALCAALFYATGKWERFVYAALAGVALGWFWLTREEGVWVLGAILILVAGAALHASRLNQIRQFAWTMATLILVFAATQVGFRIGNWIEYDSFVGVDFKEANYQRALKAIHSVRSGGVEPTISITKKARERVYAVSPSFAALKNYFDANNDGWSVHSCSIIHASCDEIGVGWFIFALRSAAASRGHYASPAAASAFFGKLADEIEAACKRGQLECQPQFLGEIPPIEWATIREQFPPHLKAAFNLLLFLNPPLPISTSGDTEALLPARLRFLNYPVHTSPSRASLITYRLSGWYLRSGSDWFSISVKDVDGAVAEARLIRSDSPDIQKGFKDPEASRQRFSLQTSCVDECVMQLASADGVKVEKKLAEFKKGGYGFQAEGFGRLHIDAASVEADPAYVATPIEDLARRIRERVLTYYQFVFLPLLSIGVLAFLVSSLRWRKAPFNVCYILALTSWVLVLSRLAVLVIMGTTIHINTTMVVNPYYGAPVFFFSVSGVVLSIAAALQLFHVAPVAAFEGNCEAGFEQRDI
jgi:hypothetical protein